MIVDILVLIILVVSALIAFLRGFVREVLTIAGVVGGMAAAYYFAPSLQPSMRLWLGVDEAADPPQQLFGIVPMTMAADALSYGAIFIAVVIVLSIISHLLAETIKSIGLGAIDRTLGIIFGLVRGVLLLALLYMPVHLFIDDETKGQWFTQSQTHFYLEVTAEWLSGFLPEETLKRLQEQASEQGDAVKEGARGTLEKMNILGGAEKKEEDQNPQDTAADSKTQKPEPAEQNKTQGYDDQIRNQMNKLLDKSKEPEKAP